MRCHRPPLLSRRCGRESCPPRPSWLVPAVGLSGRHGPQRAAPACVSGPASWPARLPSPLSPLPGTVALLPSVLPIAGHMQAFPKVGGCLELTARPGSWAALVTAQCALDASWSSHSTGSPGSRRAAVGRAGLVLGITWAFWGPLFYVTLTLTWGLCLYVKTWAHGGTFWKTEGPRLGCRCLLDPRALLVQEQHT